MQREKLSDWGAGAASKNCKSKNKTKKLKTNEKGKTI